MLEPENHNTVHAVNGSDFMANLKELRILRQNKFEMVCPEDQDTPLAFQGSSHHIMTHR